VRTVALRPDEQGAWRLDLDGLLQAITPTTRMLVVNSPNNPTGWTLTRDEQQSILDQCRRTGTVILADEVYERLYFRGIGAACAPSFLDLTEPDDAVMVAHSFSKSFLMTGWRLGWLVLPRGWADVLGKLIEFNTSCASVFVQRGALAALQHHATLVPPVVAQLRHCQAVLHQALQGVPGLRTVPSDGGMYAWLQLPPRQGRPRDGREQALALVSQVGLGLAPGGAFAPESAQWLRWCFASQDPQRLLDGVDRLHRWLALH
jgi:aspartate/methionine/tyrosine aminotransferase